MQDLSHKYRAIDYSEEKSCKRVRLRSIPEHAAHVECEANKYKCESYNREHDVIVGHRDIMA